MSARFKPGDVCVVIVSSCTPPEPAVQPGTECVVSGLSKNPIAKIAMVLDPNHPLYDVVMADGSQATLCGNCLRLKKPPAEKSDWSLIEKITGWVPTRTPIPEAA